MFEYPKPISPLPHSFFHSSATVQNSNPPTHSNRAFAELTVYVYRYDERPGNNSHTRTRCLRARFSRTRTSLLPGTVNRCLRARTRIPGRTHRTTHPLPGPHRRPRYRPGAGHFRDVLRARGPVSRGGTGESAEYSSRSRMAAPRSSSRCWRGSRSRFSRAATPRTRANRCAPPA